MKPKWHFKINNSLVKIAETHSHGLRLSKNSISKKAFKTHQFVALNVEQPKRLEWVMADEADNVSLLK